MASIAAFASRDLRGFFGTVRLQPWGRVRLEESAALAAVRGYRQHLASLDLEPHPEAAHGCSLDPLCSAAPLAMLAIEQIAGVHLPAALRTLMAVRGHVGGGWGRSGRSDGVVARCSEESDAAERPCKCAENGAAED